MGDSGAHDGSHGDAQAHGPAQRVSRRMPEREAEGAKRPCMEPLLNRSGGGMVGSSLRCSFTFSEFGRTGIGVCQDTAGQLYDMQIN